MQYLIFFISLIFLITILPVQNSFADNEPIFITISPTMKDVTFDGKWTTISEWKQSSHNYYNFDQEDKTIHLRTAHLGDHIYVFVDFVNDLTIDENKDKATICFDGKNNKNIFYDSDDFCFSVLLGSDKGTILQGISSDNSLLEMQKISNPDDFIAISNVSDENDRYSKIPHPSYEFKIPISLLERSDNYGFYLSVYDASSDKFYSWPNNPTEEKYQNISLPATWGDIISPDKSLPELHMPIIIFAIMIFSIILIQSKTQVKILH